MCLGITQQHHPKLHLADLVKRWQLLSSPNSNHETTSKWGEKRENNEEYPNKQNTPFSILCFCQCPKMMTQTAGNLGKFMADWGVLFPSDGNSLPEVLLILYVLMHVLKGKSILIKLLKPLSEVWPKE